MWVLLPSEAQLSLLRLIREEEETRLQMAERLFLYVALSLGFSLLKPFSRSIHTSSLLAHIGEVLL